MARRRFALVLLAGFAVLALLLTTVGVYGVVSYSVSRRTYEIGIRMALGAARQDVFKLVIGQGLAPTMIGVVVGLIGAFALTRLMSSLLFAVTATDPVTLVGVSLLLTGAALLACYIPARRATKIDPMVALRYE
jgi:ABC-type antimicrobial peptide transport system permease subunit